MSTKSAWYTLDRLISIAKGQHVTITIPLHYGASRLDGMTDIEEWNFTARYERRLARLKAWVDARLGILEKRYK